MYISIQIHNFLRKVYRLLLPFIYSKSNYKLFLKSSFWNLEKKILQLSCAVDCFSGIIKPIPISAPFGHTMLVIAPHQDDEIIGCGGAILLQRKVSKRIHLTFVFEGGDEYKALGYSRYEDLVMEREKESSSVSSILSIDSPVFLRSKKNRTTVHDLAEKLYTIICKVKPDVIFAPFFLDSNNEHRITAHALATALEKTPKNQKILCYEVWGLCIANVTVKIDSVINEKRDLLEIYQSQLKGTDYTNSVIGLNMYHSRLLGAGEGKFAEHYFEIPAVDYCTLIKKINRAV